MGNEALEGFAFTRDQPFSYVCNRCKRCCHGKRIPLNPYELTRLAEVLGTSTGEVIEKYTEDGLALKTVEGDETQPCVFLGPDGCTVHGGRPGACRIYPLGRTNTLLGDERFAFVMPHPESEGIYGEEGTIAGFLAKQQLAPYFEASAAYLALFQKLVAAGVFDERPEGDSLPPGADLWDVDAVVSRYCESQGRAVPPDAESKMALHIKAIEAML